MSAHPTDAEALAALRTLRAWFAVATPSPTDDDLLPLAVAAGIAATSVRVVRDAIRAGDLTAYGRERDRAVKRGDLKAWIESRRVVHAAVDDADIERRVKRIAARRKTR